MDTHRVHGPPCLPCWNVDKKSMLLVLRPSVRVRTCDMRCIVCVWERGREWGPARGRGRWVIESKVIKVIFTWWIILEHCPKATGWTQALCVLLTHWGGWISDHFPGCHIKGYQRYSLIFIKMYFFPFTCGYVWLYEWNLSILLTIIVLLSQTCVGMLYIESDHIFVNLSIIFVHFIWSVQA